MCEKCLLGTRGKRGILGVKGQYVFSGAGSGLGPSAPPVMARLFESEA